MKKIKNFTINNRRAIKQKALCFSIVNILFVYSSTIFAQSASAIGQVIINLNNNMPGVVDFISGFSVVVGVTFVFMGMFKLKHMADMRNMMQGQADVTKAIGLIAFGGFFIWSPYVLDALTYTVFGANVSSLNSRYPVQSSIPQLLPYYRAFVGVLQIIGLVSFIRGLFVLGNMTRGQQQQGAFAKGVTHIIAGVFLVNITAFVAFLEPTLGVSFSFN